MITHVVLFRPRSDLGPDARSELAHALMGVLREVPSLRRARVGTRVTLGRGYEALMRVDYTHAALLEFDDVAGLGAYLDHPAHGALASRFFEVFEEALMYDFDLEDGEAGIQRSLTS